MEKTHITVLLLILLNGVVINVRSQVIPAETTVIDTKSIAEITLNKEVIEGLQNERSILQMDKEKWEKWVTETDLIFDNHKELIMDWQLHINPPPPDLKTLELPLPFLMWKLRQEQADVIKREAAYMDAIKRGPYMDAAYMDAIKRVAAYMDAITHHHDERRIDALIDFFQQEGQNSSWLNNWETILANAATPAWASDQLRKLIIHAELSSENPIALELIKRFAEDLPNDLTLPAYEYVQQRWQPNLLRTETLAYYNLLLTIDLARGRRDVISYYESDSKLSIYDAASVLSNHKSPSSDVAKAVRRWLSTVENNKDADRLQILLLYSDPDHELKTVLARIDHIISQRNTDDQHPKTLDALDSLVLAVLNLDSDAAVVNLARYANEPSIYGLTPIFKPRTVHS
ncbi:MAG: hypothetical protein GXY61_00685 [Lentisphaerae bacterium]|nr:hypothetical protein [Lentisphaerota bacterium]